MFAVIRNGVPVKIAFALALCLTLSGCGGGPVTKANFDKINAGMSSADVEKIMGSKGTEMTGEAAKAFSQLQGGMPGGGAGAPDLGNIMGALGMKIVRWGDDNRYIVVFYMQDKVAGKDSKGL